VQDGAASEPNRDTLALPAARPTAASSAERATRSIILIMPVMPVMPVLRRAARLFVLGALGLGCSRTPRHISSLESPPIVPAAAEPPPAIEVRAVPTAAFMDPNRQKKIAASLPAIHDIVARIVAADNLVGLAVGVVIDGKLVLGEGFGARDAEQGGAIDIHTAFRIGSITKLFTAMTALRLWKEGRLDLDGPAAAMLPELHTLVYPNADARPLSIRDILTHTAGLPLVLDLPAAARSDGLTRDELMKALDGLSLVRSPGLTYEYSNLGFALLGHIIAAASGKPYHDTIRAAILEPLGMTHTVWEPSEVPPPQLALGHAVVDGRVVVVRPSRHGANDAAGGLLSTVEDLARFLAFQLDAWPPRSDADDAPLARTTSREAQRMHVMRSFRARTAPVELADGGVEGGATGVGLAWGVTHGCENPYVVAHNGAVNGYHASVRMLPHAGVGIIVLSNAGWADTDQLAEEIQHALAVAGALSRRAPQPLPALNEAAARIVAMLGRWDTSAFAGLGIHPLAEGSAGQRLAARMQWLYEALGACTLGPLKVATSAWSGVYRVTCERGTAELTLALTSARTPKVSSVSLAWIGGTPSPAVQDAAAAALALLTDFDDTRFRALFSPGFNRTTMDRILARVRFEQGTCRLARPLEVRSTRDTTYALTCDRGNAKLSLVLDNAQPARIVSFQVDATGARAACR
jgi:CubicO group peptidase (beta-lactamase class C family)